MQHRTTTPYPPPDIHPARASTAGPCPGHTPTSTRGPWPPPDVHSALGRGHEYPYGPSSSQQQRPSYPPPRSHTAAPPAAVRHAHAHPPTDVSPGSAPLRDARHYRAPSAPLMEPRHHSHPDPHPATPPRPPFLIIGLFALRLAHTLVQSLPSYPSRTADLAWLSSFLSPYDPSYDLAVLRGEQREEYEEMYPKIVARMKRVDGFPRAFAGVDPRTRDRNRSREERGETPMSDGERKDIIDFVHAAAEWGSTVLVPEREAERMMVLAERRRVVDLEREGRKTDLERERGAERGQGRERERERMVDVSGLRFGGGGEREGVYGDGRRRR